MHQYGLYDEATGFMTNQGQAAFDHGVYERGSVEDYGLSIDGTAEDKYFGHVSYPGCKI